jgi:hypothetical protein
MLSDLLCTPISLIIGEYDRPLGDEEIIVCCLSFDKKWCRLKLILGEYYRIFTIFSSGLEIWFCFLYIWGDLLFEAIPVHR